jgi:hypothetical protein
VDRSFEKAKSELLRGSLRCGRIFGADEDVIEFEGGHGDAGAGRMSMTILKWKHCLPI